MPGGGWLEIKKTKQYTYRSSNSLEAAQEEGAESRGEATAEADGVW
jgi:hypothetical protein